MNNEGFFSHDGLFQIGEIAKCCAIDRQTILFYEKLGLIKPTAKNESSGYRYYSVEAVTELIEILQLKLAGLSLAEIREYKDSGAIATQSVIALMEKKIETLRMGIETVKSISIKKGDYTVLTTTVPEELCYRKEYLCKDVAEATEYVYQTIGEVISSGVSLSGSSAFVEFIEEIGAEIKLSDFLMRAYVPVTANSLPNCVFVPKHAAIYVCHRGDYSQIGEAYNAIWEYVKQHKLTPTGPIREYYLDSRRGYTDTQDRYVTRVVLPV